MKTGIQKAAEIAGGNAKLAAILGVHPSYLSQLINGHRKVPIKRISQIIEATGGAVTREQLRPDVFCESV